MKTLKPLGCVFAALLSWTQMATAQSDIQVNAILSELRVGHYGQLDCNHAKCPNVEASVLPASNGSHEDSLQIKLDIAPNDCDGDFMFKNVVSQFTDFGINGAPPVYRFFDTISLDHPGSTCMGVDPRPLLITVPIQLDQGRTRLRFLQMNNQYTEVSYASVVEGHMLRIRDVKVENNK